MNWGDNTSSLTAVSPFSVVYEDTCNGISKGEVEQVARHTPVHFRMIESPVNFFQKEQLFTLPVTLEFRGAVRGVKKLSDQEVLEIKAAKELSLLVNRYKTFAAIVSKKNESASVFTSGLRGCIVTLDDMMKLGSILSENDAIKFLPQYSRWFDDTNTLTCKVLPQLYKKLVKHVNKTVKHTKNKKILSEKMRTFMESTLMENFLDCSRYLEESHMKNPVPLSKVAQLTMDVARFIK